MLGLFGPFNGLLGPLSCELFEPCDGNAGNLFGRFRASGSKGFAETWGFMAN